MSIKTIIKLLQFFVELLNSAAVSKAEEALNAVDRADEFRDKADEQMDLAASLNNEAVIAKRIAHNVTNLLKV